jgi:hypothetical protein
MWVRVETSRVGPARLPPAASWRGSSSFAYRIHWRSGRSGGGDAHLSENAREFVWGERVTVKGFISFAATKTSRSRRVLIAAKLMNCKAGRRPRHGAAGLKRSVWAGTRTVSELQSSFHMVQISDDFETSLPSGGFRVKRPVETVRRMNPAPQLYRLLFARPSA